MEVTDNKVIHLDPTKERLVIRFGCLLKSDTRHKIQQEILEQYKTGVVVLPPLCAAFVVKNESIVDIQFPEIDYEEE